MAYNFKSIADVDVINNPSDSTNVLIEEDGFIKRVPKSAVGETAENMISKIGTVEVAETVTDETNVLIEEDGTIKRVSKDKVVPANVVTSPVTASVGQTIVVKAVDEAGKPTEWEAADMVSGEAPDLVVTITVSGELDEESINDYGVANVTEVVGSVQSVLDKISNGQNPSVIIKSSYVYGGSAWNGCVKNPTVIKKGDSLLHLVWIQCSGYIHWYYHELEIDNTNTPVYYYGCD